MRLNIIAGGLITEVYDDHNKKVVSVSMSKEPKRRNKPYSCGTQFHATFNEALIALLKRKKVNIRNVL